MKKVLAGLFIIVLIMLGGCAKADKTDDKTGQEELMNQYQVLINDNKPARELTGFIESNKTNLSQENISKAVIDLIEVQQTHIKNYEDKMFSNEINIPLNRYKYDDLIQLRDIKEDSIKNLLQDAFSNGYKLATSEGMYYLEIDYGKILNDFRGYTSNETAGYLEIMADEYNKHTAEDAAIVISLDELAGRIIKTEKYIDSYPGFAKIQQVKQLHNNYLKAYLLGLNNTPLFDYQTKKAKDKFLNSYENTITSQKGTKLAGILEEYLVLLKKSDYTGTEEIMDFINRVTQ